MPLADQGLDAARYLLIPRTVIFLRRGDSYLLLKGAATKRLWAGKYNGLGGHVEPGEDVLTAARREVREEAGLEAELWLCGIVLVEAGNAGVCLFVFGGECPSGKPRPSAEGVPEWVTLEQVSQLPIVEDVPLWLSKIHSMKRGDPPFFARSFYDAHGQLVVHFAQAESHEQEQGA